MGIVWAQSDLSAVYFSCSLWTKAAMQAQACSLDYIYKYMYGPLLLKFELAPLCPISAKHQQTGFFVFYIHH